MYKANTNVTKKMPEKIQNRENQNTHLKKYKEFIETTNNIIKPIPTFQNRKMKLFLYNYNYNDFFETPYSVQCIYDNILNLFYDTTMFLDYLYLRT